MMVNEIYKIGTMRDTAMRGSKSNHLYKKDDTKMGGLSMEMMGPWLENHGYSNFTRIGVLTVPGNGEPSGQSTTTSN